MTEREKIIKILFDHPNAIVGLSESKRRLAALRALGYKLMTREPTNVMSNAMWSSKRSDSTLNDIFRDAWDAAPDVMEE